MIITKEFLEAIRTKNGGYTKAQMYLVAYFLGETITPNQIFPNNWKSRLDGMEISDVWVSKLIKAKDFSARDLFRLGVTHCTGLSKERADIIMPIKTKSEKRRKAKNKRRYFKRC